jgi:hypothetical protein
VGNCREQCCSSRKNQEGNCRELESSKGDRCSMFFLVCSIEKGGIRQWFWVWNPAVCAGSVINSQTGSFNQEDGQ